MTHSVISSAFHDPSTLTVLYKVRCAKCGSFIRAASGLSADTARVLTRLIRQLHDDVPHCDTLGESVVRRVLES